MQLDWDDLRIFLAVVRLKRIATAARTLGVDASTIGRRLRRLGDALDADLFEQSGTERSLTAKGQMLLAHAEAVELSTISAMADIKGERHRLSGQVRVSVAEGFGTWILAPGLSRFKDAHPDISVDVITASGFLNPSKREADMAIMLARPQRGLLMVERLADYRLHLYASKQYLDRKGRPASRSDLQRHVLIGYVPDFLFSPELDYLDEVAAGLHPGLRSSSITIQRRLVLEGAGIGVLPDFLAAADEDLETVLPSDVEIVRSFWLVIHRDMAKLARIGAVADMMRKQVRDLL